MPKKPPKEFKVSVEPKVRRKNVSSAAFKPGNEHAFKPGQSGNPSGRSPSKDRLLSRALKTQLSSRMPDDFCDRIGVPHWSSWATGLAMLICKKALSGDIGYAKLLAEYVEPAPTQRVTFEPLVDEDGNVLESQTPFVQVNFVESEYCKQHPEERGTMTVTPPTQMPPPLIEARLTEPTEVKAEAPAAPMPQPVQYPDPRKDPKSIWFRG